MLLVGDVYFREEGLFLRETLEADAVREPIVYPAVLRVGAHFPAVDRHVPALVTEGRGRGDRRRRACRRL